MKNCNFTTPTFTSITMSNTGANTALTLGATAYTGTAVANAFGTTPNFTRITLSASLTALTVGTTDYTYIKVLF